MIIDALLYRINLDITTKNSAFFRIHRLKNIGFYSFGSYFSYPVFINQINSYIFSLDALRFGYMIFYYTHSHVKSNQKASYVSLF